MKCFHLTRLSLAIVSAVLLLGACGVTSPAPTAAVTSAPTAAPAVPATVDPTSVEVPTLPPASTLAATAVPDVPFTLTSTAFAEGEVIPDQYTYRLGAQCTGANLSPQLTWVGTPAHTQSLAVIVSDPDGGDWAHWVQFNIPGDATSLPEATAGPNLGLKGRNDFGELGYGGPCPPGGTHHYIFTLYALDATLSVAEGATRSEVEQAMADHILGQTQLTGLRSK